MSFLSRTTPLLRTSIRSSVVRSSPRVFSTAIVQHKSATDSVKDGLKSVDRAVSDVAVAGIDKGVEVKDAAAEAVGMPHKETIKGKSKGDGDVAAGEAQGKANELAGEAKGKAAEVSGKVQGKAEEVKRKMS